MAKMKIYVNSWSIVPSDAGVEFGAEGRGLSAGVSGSTDDESFGRFGSVLITIRRDGSPTKEYEFLDSAFRGSSFRMTTAVREFEIPDSPVLGQLSNTNYLIRLKIMAHSQSAGNIAFDVREIGRNGYKYGPIHIRHVLLENTTGTYFELFGQCRENTALIDSRRELY